MLVELHCHSTRSDGLLTPQAVAQRAINAGVELFCLTDHDTCSGFEEASKRVAPIPTMRAMELTCSFQGRAVHLLVYDTCRNGAWADIEQLGAGVIAARRSRLLKIADRLQSLNIEIDGHAILKEAGDRPVGRPDIAAALVACGAVTNRQQAFQRYLHDGGPADVPMKALSVADAVSRSHEAGARVALAHPHTVNTLAHAIVNTYRHRGLSGIEAYYGFYNEPTRQRWLSLADEKNLVATGGSDFHGHETPPPRLGVQIPPRQADHLREWLEL